MPMLELHDMCRRLKLSRTLADRAYTLTADSNQEFLVKLFAQEIADRQTKRNDALIKAAGFYSRKTPGEFITEDIQFPPGGGFDDLLSLRFIEDKWNIVMYGGTGTGKTMLSTIIGLQACQQGVPVKFYRTAALVNALCEAKNKGELSKLLGIIDRAELLILDEWGYVPLDTSGSQLLFNIIAERYERKSVVLNTNIEFSNWVNILYDPKMTVALIARMLHHCHLLLFNGTDRRLKESSVNNLYSGIAAGAAGDACKDVREGIR